MSRVGRPSLYDEAYCEQVIAWGKEGKSKAWMASAIGVSREALYEWERVHPEFSDALTRAMAHSQAWWEDQGQTYMVMPVGAGTFNGSVWSRSMAARFPADWREKSEQTIQGPGGGGIQVITRKIVDSGTGS